MESEDEEVIEFIKNESVKLQDSRARAAFFTGVRFSLRLDTFEIRLIVPRREIVYMNEIYPNFHISVKNLCLKAGFVDENFACQLTLEEVNIIDYFKPSEHMSPAMRHAVEAFANPRDENDYNPDDASRYLSSLSRSGSEYRGTSQASREVDYFSNDKYQRRPGTQIGTDLRSRDNSPNIFMNGSQNRADRFTTHLKTNP